MISIPQNQICQAFDPIMILPEKSKNIVDPMKMNTSCVAPAYVYLEGSRGKRFLCDYHFTFEKDATMHRTPDQWKYIEEFLFDNLEKVKDTFSQNKTNFIKNEICWCKKIAYIRITHKFQGGVQFFCNFHFRKAYYRYLSNGIKFEKEYEIIDERYKMVETIHEEYSSLQFI
jgi:hypothetical protein